MNSAQRLPVSLTALDSALAALLGGLGLVAAKELPVCEALGCVTADVAPTGAYPSRDIALADGWAVRANDLVGASAYAPVPLIAAARWVEAGDPIPDGWLILDVK